VSEIVDKVLRSGLIDKHTAELMEHYGMLPAGASDTVGKLAKDQMKKLAQELAEMMEREHILRETMLDLEKLRWPAHVMIRPTAGATVPRGLFSHVFDVMLDKMGRYYFRPQDVKKEWLVLGYALDRIGPDRADSETIIEVTDLFLGDQVAAIQVVATRG
jgi:hypothetical protein